jgi:hypothetical protein
MGVSYAEIDFYDVSILCLSFFIALKWNLIKFIVSRIQEEKGAYNR